MLRGKGSCGLSFSLGLIAAVSLVLRRGGPLLPAALAAAAAAALAVALLAADPAAARWAGVLLLAASLGGGIGLARALAVVRGGREGPSPAALRGVTAFEGILVADSVTAADRGAPSGGRTGGKTDTLYTLRLQRLVRGKEGIRAPAAGRLTLRVRQGPRAWQGERLVVRGAIRAGFAGGATVAGVPAPLVCRAEPADLKRAGIAAPAWGARRHLLQALAARSARIGEPAAALFRAFFLGERDGIPVALQSSFTRSGSLHLLAISGQHVGILVLLATGCLFWIPFRPWRMAAGAALAAGYLFLIGPLPSLSRAVLVLAAGSLGALLDRDPEPLNLLALSAGILVLADPMALTTLSFQLSYLALLGILLPGAGLTRGLSRVLPPFLCPPLAASLGAYAFTTPLLLASFGVTYPVGILAALPLVPLVTVFIAGGLACLLLPAPPWSLLEEPARLAMRLLYAGIDRLMGLFAAAPSVHWDAAGCGLPPGWVLLPVLLCAIASAPDVLVARIRAGAGLWKRRKGPGLLPAPPP